MFGVGGIACGLLAHSSDGFLHIGVCLVDLVRACHRDEFNGDLSLGKLISKISDSDADSFAGKDSTVDGLDVIVAAPEFPAIPLVLVAPVRLRPSVEVAETVEPE